MFPSQSLWLDMQQATMAKTIIIFPNRHKWSKKIQRIFFSFLMYEWYYKSPNKNHLYSLNKYLWHAIKYLPLEGMFHQIFKIFGDQEYYLSIFVRPFYCRSSNNYQNLVTLSLNLLYLLYCNQLCTVVLAIIMAIHKSIRNNLQNLVPLTLYTYGMYVLYRISTYLFNSV